MIPELGNFAIMLALCIALLQGVIPLLGATRGIPRWVAYARPIARGQFLFLLIAILCLGWSFVVNDFSVRFVAENSNSTLPFIYRIAAIWGGHEGSVLLWVFILSGWTFAVSFLSRGLPENFVARVLGVMGLVSSGLLLFILATSNPFTRLFPAPPNGADLNPLLQDPVMAIHPPMLYMGYVGFSVAFSFAIAALLAGRLDATWARWSRPWTLAAWGFLTLGITLGSWWSYYELGWGGWWFWDPVENASFMPWLVGTALVHSLAVTDKRGAFRNWTALLAIAAFSLSLLGTFLVRSGVITSVHAFASDPTRGIFILGFLVLVVGSSLTLYAARAGRVGTGATFTALSRESLLLGNNLLLAVAMATVLLGTLYPLAMDALGLGKISVGFPYFNTVFLPLMVPMLFLMGLGPNAGWHHASPADLSRRLRWGAVIALLIGLIIPWLMGDWRWRVAFWIAIATWLAAGVLSDACSKLGRSGIRQHWHTVMQLPRGWWGMLTAHLGVAMFIVGITLSGAYSIESDLRMAPGDTAEVGGYQFRFDGIQSVQGPNYQATRGRVIVTRKGQPVTVLYPEKRHYPEQRNPTTEAAVDGGLRRHLYVALGDKLQDGAWTVRLYYKPWVACIWGGAVLMAVGGLMAATDRRYRMAVRARRAAGIENAAAGAPP